jgi:hypothetical protein
LPLHTWFPVVDFKDPDTGDLYSFSLIGDIVHHTVPRPRASAEVLEIGPLPGDLQGPILKFLHEERDWRDENADGYGRSVLPPRMTILQHINAVWGARECPSFLSVAAYNFRCQWWLGLRSPFGQQYMRQGFVLDALTSRGKS